MVEPPELARLAPYRALRIPFLFCSAKAGLGIEELRALIAAKTVVFVAPPDFPASKQNRQVVRDFLTSVRKRFDRVVSIEDGCAEGDKVGWKLMTDKLGSKIHLIGDDLFVTNPKILAEGIRDGIANGLLVKVNQIGTITETLEAVRMAQVASYVTAVSHRSGETEDTTIADLAVATNSMFIKTGSASRSERLAKYNRLLRIEEELADAGRFFGLTVKK